MVFLRGKQSLLDCSEYVFVWHSLDYMGEEGRDVLVFEKPVSTTEVHSLFFVIFE